MLGDAVEHGYRISFIAGRITVLQGKQTFNPPSPTGPWAWEGRDFPLIVPAWTQTGDIGAVSWRHLWLAARPGQRGLLMKPVFFVLHPGRYTAEFVLAPGGAATAGRGVAGEATVTVKGVAHPVRAFVDSATKMVRLSFQVPAAPGNQRREVGLSLCSNGRALLRLLQVRLYQERPAGP